MLDSVTLFWHKCSYWDYRIGAGALPSAEGVPPALFLGGRTGMAETVVGMHWVPGGMIVPKVKKSNRAWTAAKERKFLDHLAATCNVSASLREVGATATSAYGHRQKSAQFRAEWNRALSEG
jgi:hypothetical protein